MSIIKIGSRKSQLAIKQTEAVIKKLKEHFPNDTFEIVGISTKGDRQLDKSLQSFGGKGVFIKEIETALLSGEIDMAVHSAKDMPTEICDGLTISAALLRDDRSDVLVHFGDTKSSDIKITVLPFPTLKSKISAIISYVPQVKVFLPLKLSSAKPINTHKR